MNNDIKVSVIVITYNHEQFIKQALDSILMQKVDFKYEILIGDDASTDRTPEILKEYKKLYPDIIDLHLNSVNLGATRNAYNLLMIAKGKYLAYCEGDDYWIHDHKLQIQVEFLEKNNNYIGCSHKCVLVDKNNKKLLWQKLDWIKNIKIFKFKDFSGGRFLPGQTTTIVKKNIFLDKNVDYTVLYSSDRDISDRIANEIFLLKGDFYILSLFMSAYRISNTQNYNSITFKKFKNNKNKYLDEMSITEALEKYAKTQNVNVIFKIKRCEIFSDIVVNFFRYRELKYLNILIENYKFYKTPWYAIVYCPYYIFLKIYRKVIRFITIKIKTFFRGEWNYG